LRRAPPQVAARASLVHDGRDDHGRKLGRRGDRRPGADLDRRGALTWCSNSVATANTGASSPSSAAVAIIGRQLDLDRCDERRPGA
jgi:hypothetical protein